MPVKRIAIPAGREFAYTPDEWNDSLVTVEQGSIELESLHGVRRTFVAGDMLPLRRLHLRVLRNRGRTTATLVARTR